MNEQSPPDLLVEHAWRYFELHATQRMSVFNFFLALSGALTAGMAASIQGNQNFTFIGIALGLLLSLVSFIFWKLDQRVSFLIKHAEQALSEIEHKLPSECVRLFHLEPKRSEKNLKIGNMWSRHWTYGRCFRTVFFAMGMLGILGSALSAFRFFTTSGW